MPVVYEHVRLGQGGPRGEEGSPGAGRHGGKSSLRNFYKRGRFAEWVVPPHYSVFGIRSRSPYALMDTQSRSLVNRSNWPYVTYLVGGILVGAVLFGVLWVVMPPLHFVSMRCPIGTESFVEYELFLGRSHQDVEVVDDDAWRAFFEEEVTPRFPDGSTVIDGWGQWRDSSGIIVRERSRVLLILATPGGRARVRIQEIADAYVRTFDQESVLLATGTECVSFEGP